MAGSSGDCAHLLTSSGAAIARLGAGSLVPPLDVFVILFGLVSLVPFELAGRATARRSDLSPFAAAVAGAEERTRYGTISRGLQCVLKHGCEMALL